MIFDFHLYIETTQIIIVLLSVITLYLIKKLF